MQKKWAGRFSGWLCSAALLGACSPSEDAVVSRGAAVIGQGGDRTIMSQEVVNQYAVLSADAAAGSKAIKLQSLPTMPGLQAGDVLFIIQMQGAAIDRLSDSPKYGSVEEIRNAGHYEMLTVTGLEPATNTVQVRGLGSSGLKFDYEAAGHTQVIVVPQYRNLTVAAGGTLSAPAWNGSTGGVVVVTADTVQVDGAISASGVGFRGGQRQNGGAVTFPGFRLGVAAIGGERGEGAGGSQLDYDALNGRFGRAAAANGGGGGNSINSAGGGGANGLAKGKVWTGQGVMDVSSNDLKAAWMLDPAYAALGNTFSDSAGGGRGGYGCSTASLDPTTSAPSLASWGCSNRAPYGGFGGRPLQSEVQRRLFFGGGGGAGHQNDSNGGAGGNGGGLVFVLARNIQGIGSITADGGPGGAAGMSAGAPDGPGGGGGGGTVVLMTATSLSAVQISAVGGAGGNHQSSGEAEGGGGGGGGGFVAMVGPSAAQPTVTGGKAGTTNLAAFAKMPTNGGTDGASGAMERVSSFSPDFLPPVQAVDLQVTLGLGSTMRPGYTKAPVFATVTNLGPDPAVNVQTTITLPAGIPGTVTSSGAFTCTQQGQDLFCRLPELAVGTSETLEISLNLPRDPQGPFLVSSTVSGGGFDYVAANDQASLSAEISGYVQLAGNGLSCAMNGSARGSSAAGWVLLLASLAALGVRRRSARGLALLAGLLGVPACIPSPQPVNLSVTVTGQGSVTSDDGAIACGAQCTKQAMPGTSVRLSAIPADRQRFMKWDGRCSGTVPTCELTLLDDSQALAVFEPIPDSCFDGVKNTNETAVDCGGGCAPCEDGKACQAKGDCLSGMCISGLCSSCALGTELVINGGAEIPGNAQYLLGWTSTGVATVPYDSGFLGSTVPGPTNRGKNHFTGGDTAMSTATQGIDLRACGPLIDKGVLTYQLSAWLGGFSTQNDNARLSVLFQDGQMATKKTSSLGPVMSADRSGMDSLLLRTDSGDVPASTRYLSVTLTSTRTDGVSCDGYADNISMVLGLKP